MKEISVSFNTIPPWDCPGLGSVPPEMQHKAVPGKQCDGSASRRRSRQQIPGLLPRVWGAH